MRFDGGRLAPTSTARCLTVPDLPFREKQQVGNHTLDSLGGFIRANSKATQSPSC